MRCPESINETGYQGLAARGNHQRVGKPGQRLLGIDDAAHNQGQKRHQSHQVGAQPARDEKKNGHGQNNERECHIHSSFRGHCPSTRCEQEGFRPDSLVPPVDGLALLDRLLDDDVLDGYWVHHQGVGREDDEIGDFAGLDGALDFFLKDLVSTVDGDRA